MRQGRWFDVWVFFVAWVVVVCAAAWLARRAMARRRRPVGLLTRCERCGAHIRTDARICSHCFRRAAPARAARRKDELRARPPDE